MNRTDQLSRRAFMGATMAAGLLPAAPAVHAQPSLRRLVLAIGTAPPDPASHYLYYAREKGFYKANGIEVDIKGMVSATNATRAVIAGEADIGWTDAVSSIIARDQGAKLKVISAFAGKLDYSVVGTKAITGLKFLEGKRFAVATVGGGTEIVTKVMLERAGGTNKAVQYIALGNSAARAQALVAGTVDATIVTSSFIPRLLGYPNLHVVSAAIDEIPDFVYTWEIASESGAAKNKDALASFVAASAQAVRWAYDNPDQAADLSAALLPDANPGEIRSGIKSYLARRFWSVDGKLPANTMEFTGQRLLEAGVIKRTPVYGEFYAGDIAELAAGKRPT